VTLVSGNVTDLAAHAAPLPAAEAAALLGVPEAALLRWSCEFGFPARVGLEEVPCFAREQIDVLHVTLAASHSVEGAIREAQRRLGLTT
jgi:hypothetical protein